jgi:hypothetical protein
VTEAGTRPEPAQRMSVVIGNTLWPVGDRDMRDRLRGNRHLHDPVESIIMNVGGPIWDAKESGITHVGTRAKSSDAHTGSQRGHSSPSAGKPRTWRRATACQVRQSTTLPLYTSGYWLGGGRKRR